MTDTSTTTGSNKKTVAAAANQCLESFNKCLLQQSSIHPREFSLVEDQVARFSTWTSGIGVFAPGRASMDHRLRYAPEVQSITISLLESLNYRIQKLLELLHGHINGPETHISSILDERLGKLLDYIAAEISHLNKMSNIIRKASQDSQNIQARDFHMTDEEGNDLQPILLSHYKRYIGEGFPTASVTIQQRLADAMILRRKRILYRRSRYGGTAIQLPKVENKVSLTLPDSLLQLEDKQKVIAPSQIKSATTLQPEKFKTAASSPSVVSTTMTVALGNHEALKFPTAPGLHAKRKYEQFKAEQLAAHHAMLGRADEPSSATDPALNAAVGTRDAKRRLFTEQQLSKVFKPDVPAIGEVTCPYCFYTLSLEEIFNEKKWQNHVKNDLDPYVCLFEECSEPDELYKHSEKWLSHMNQHIQRWRCPSHRELGLFPTCEGYMQHMRDVHDTKLNDSKLRALANRNVRSLPKLFVSCPLCGKDESEINTRLTDHITGHLRSLAILSLPIHYDEDIPGDVGSDKNGSNGSQPRSRSTINLLDDEDILVIRSAIDGSLDDIAEPSAAVDAAASDEDFVDMLFQQDNTHSDSVQHSEHVRVNKTEIISSPESSDGQNSTQSTTQFEYEANSRHDMDSDDIDMSNPQLEQEHAPQEDSSDVAGPSNEQYMTPKESQCWECQRRGIFCDGKIPICDKCSEAGIICPGYNDARPLTWLPTSKVSRLQKGESQSGSSSNRSDLGRSHIGNKQEIAGRSYDSLDDPFVKDPLSNLNRISSDSVVGNDFMAEAEIEPMVPQPKRWPAANQLQQLVYQTIMQNTLPMDGTTWHSSFSVNERMGKALGLITNISLAMGGLDWNRATKFGCQFEREEAYSQAMTNKTIEFFKKRQANEGYLQNNTSTNATVQAQAQAEAQALMLQAQMSRGMATSQTSFTDTSSTPVTSSDNISPKVPQDMGQAGVQSSDQQFHQGVPKPNHTAFNAMLANMTPEQRQAINDLPKEKLIEVLRRWQSHRQDHMQAMDRNSMIQPQMTSQPQTIRQETTAGVELSSAGLPHNVNTQSTVDRSMVSYVEDADEDTGSTVDAVLNRRFNAMDQLFDKHDNTMDQLFDKHDNTMDQLFDKHDNAMDQLFEKHDKEMNRILDTFGRKLKETTQPERIRRSQDQYDRSRSPRPNINKRMVAYVEDVDEDAGNTIGMESTRRYARSPPPRSPERFNISKIRMPEPDSDDEIASSISSHSPYSDSTPAPYRNHHHDPQDSQEPHARAPPDSAVFARPIEDDDGEGDHGKPRLRPKNRDSRDSRDPKDLSNPRGPKKAQHNPTKHATTQPVVSQRSHRRGQFEDPAAYGVQQAQQLQQPAASGRPRAKSRPASYYAGQPPRPPPPPWMYSSGPSGLNHDANTATSTMATEDPDITRAKILVLRAAMTLGFDRDTITDPKTAPALLQKFVQSLPADAFGTAPREATLLQQFKNSVLIPYSIPSRGKRVSAIDMAKSIQTLANSSPRYTYLRDLFTFVFKFPIEDVEARRHISIAV
ncbi:hypothetical protein J3E69DRAFT_373099 [Trichoderma sp. SZMC 28015]